MDDVDAWREIRRRPGWTLITNHGACLIYIADHPDATVREIAEAVEITERAAARILRNLREEGYLNARRVGRRNVYQLDPDLPLRHPVGENKQVSDLLVGLVNIDSRLRGRDTPPVSQKPDAAGGTPPLRDVDAGAPPP